MKKLILISLFMAGFMNAFAQQEQLEKKLGIKELDLKALPDAGNRLAAKINCSCEKNLIKDGSFASVLVSGSNISSLSPIWKPGAATPQHTKAMGACDSGFVSMWGNQTVGESIYQTGLSLKQGKCYTVKFNARFLNNTGKNNPYVKLAVVGSASATPASPFPLSSSAAGSLPITNPAWASYSLTFTASSNFTTLSFFPVNGNLQNDGAYVSWIQLDNICIEECCACDIPKTPPIKSSADLLCACDAIKFTTISCPTATYKWTVTDDKGNNISFNGGNTNAITLNYSLAQQVASSATAFIVTVEITCGNQTVKNTVKTALKPVPKTNVSFSLTDNGNGSYTATAGSLATANGNGWTLKEVNCPGPNPCSWVAGVIKWQSAGSTINIPNGVLVKGKCYVLTHYVNVCSPKWIAGPCTVYKATCFKLDGNNALMKIKSSESDKNDAREISQEMLKEILDIKEAPQK